MTIAQMAYIASCHETSQARELFRACAVAAASGGAREYGRMRREFDRYAAMGYRRALEAMRDE